MSAQQVMRPRVSKVTVPLIMKHKASHMRWELVTSLLVLPECFQFPFVPIARMNTMKLLIVQLLFLFVVGFTRRQ